jgi:lipocalin
VYKKQPDGTFSVSNKGFKADGSESGVTGTLSCPNSNDKAKLKLQVCSFLILLCGRIELKLLQIHLFGVFNPSADFWIIELAPDYSYFVASGPKRTCWIFSATPTMDDEVYNGILEKCKTQQIDISQVSKTEQTRT